MSLLTLTSETQHLIASVFAETHPSKQKSITMKKITKGIRIDQDVWGEFEKVVGYQHMEPQAFAVVLIKTFSDLKQGYALQALSSIPRECFKSKGGRPPSQLETSKPSGEGVRVVGAEQAHSLS